MLLSPWPAILGIDVCVGLKRTRVFEGVRETIFGVIVCQVDAAFHQPQECTNQGCTQSEFARALRQGFHPAIWDHYLGLQWRNEVVGESSVAS